MCSRHQCDQCASHCGHHLDVQAPITDGTMATAIADDDWLPELADLFGGC
jgi:hypothetical protein